MKLKSFLPPVIALVVAGGWLGFRRQVLSGIEKENSTYREKLRTHQSGTADDIASPKPATPAEWKTLSSQALKYNWTGFGGLALKKRFNAMSREELAASLDELSKSNFGAEEILREMLVKALLEKDPGFALDLLTGKLPEDRSHFLAEGMKNWALASPEAAAAWFDEQLEKGTFASKRLDGMSVLKHKMEPALISALLSSAPEMAVKRLSAINEEDRAKFLHPHAQEKLSEEKQIAFARMVRELLPAQSARNLINSQCAEVAAQGGYQAASDYFTRIGATPEEREACVEYCARRILYSRTWTAKINAGDVEELRAWVGSQAPSATDRATGGALANISGNDYTGAADLAAYFHEKTGSDEILISFIRNSEWLGHPSEARQLAGKIVDEESRKGMLDWLESE
ncbi:hypothetical protein JIN84_00795 [Luteolibacter yonseiensis]|uniref:Uncharacterized protein n=1 Tax=Luteolibacter yonseiensis TaxID=1144680 RepID=A0A934V9G4_9BACT|nr:hypothetical protein [Luteolibacter yonseiensis]MBK1814145.1 hypothetical protein [Luteolibacter yonseiensis]